MLLTPDGGGQRQSQATGQQEACRGSSMEHKRGGSPGWGGSQAGEPADPVTESLRHTHLRRKTREVDQLESTQHRALCEGGGGEGKGWGRGGVSRNALSLACAAGKSPSAWPSASLTRGYRPNSLAEPGPPASWAATGDVVVLRRVRDLGWAQCEDRKKRARLKMGTMRVSAGRQRQGCRGWATPFSSGPRGDGVSEHTQKPVYAGWICQAARCD